MKILYISCHEVLEFEELTLLTELGHQCFSLGGAYTDPRGHITLRRPGIPGMLYQPELVELSSKFPRTEIPDSFLDLFDLIIVMHIPDVILQNWDRLKGRKVIWRSIGQSTPWVEKQLERCRNEGLKIVRYSPMEAKLPNYIGEDMMIRFYKDPEEYKGWTGTDKKVVNFTQTLKGRRAFCGYDAMMKVIPGFPFKVYGSGNEDLAEFNGGSLPFELMKGQLRDARVFLYGGTWPASYTLSFIEAWMTGIPVVAVGEELWRHKDNPDVRVYEVQKLIDHGDTGFCSDDIEMLRKNIKRLLNDDDYAKKIGDAGRAEAILIFGKERISGEWDTYLKTLCP